VAALDLLAGSGGPSKRGGKKAGRQPRESNPLDLFNSGGGRGRSKPKRSSRRSTKERDGFGLFGGSGERGDRKPERAPLDFLSGSGPFQSGGRAPALFDGEGDTRGDRPPSIVGEGDGDGTRRKPPEWF